ncbi:tetratricopeptide repeat protein [Microbulbifer pacificus]|uniref:Tetratricopeptide repeat protein n=2 Tax=Microbulbifer pacificus TaxID=407164 RepID=A0AAU0N2J6_9GAMM|nr:tetratricopeptide repeat protein [Microbulbifer pacificus]WOX07031.1 tetratricopeptide repeat protein [Microbulbifer pacificus]
MAHASAQSVKGNFENQTLHALGIEHRFYRQDDGFWVSTQGVDGGRAEFQVRYTFGTEPLQQYLVEMDGGRLQALPLAWDTAKNRWFHLQEHQVPQPGEWIHWTQGGMNWNSMCADCHSTGLKKNFDTKTGTYDTHWAEIDVGCEACHGPGSIHIAQVSEGKALSQNTLYMIRGEPAAQLVEGCGRCHARRQQLTPVFTHGSNTLLNHYLPMNLQAGPYHSDGQINEEVFVYGSFTQSKMYQMGVGCIDCHDPHSTRIKRPGNTLCTGCHAPQKYDTPEHHHHPMAATRQSDAYTTGSGNQCVDCHMPGQNYMTNDFRRDHSLRIPRPDLSVAFGIPNACNTCHEDKSPEWATRQIDHWYGSPRPAHFSETLARAIQAATEPTQITEPLAKLLDDRNQPAIARATAADLLAPLLNEPHAFEVLQQALTDTNPLVRTAAARAFYSVPMAYKQSRLIPLLSDPVAAVRITAVQSLVEMEDAQLLSLPSETQRHYRDALAEYQQSLEVNDDFVSSSHQRGLDLEKAGHFGAAIQAYEHALTIDDRANASRMNLAQIHYQYHQFDKSEELFRKVLSQEPDAAPTRYALGLLLAEMGKLEDAEKELENAALTGNNARIWYNLGVLRHQQRKWQDSEEAYHQALALEPTNVEYISALASLLIQRGKHSEAKKQLVIGLKSSPTDQRLLRLDGYLDSLKEG